MAQTLIERLTSTPEGMRVYQQERLILEITELICDLMAGQKIKKADLAERLGKSRAYVSQLLDGRTNMTVRTISDVFFALGRAACVTAGPAELASRKWCQVLTFRAPEDPWATVEPRGKAPLQRDGAKGLVA